MLRGDCTDAKLVCYPKLKKKKTPHIQQWTISVSPTPLPQGLVLAETKLISS